MKTLRFLMALCAFPLVLPIQGIAQYLYLDSALTITSSTTFDSVRITSTGQLTADDSIAVLGNMIIDSGGVVTHSLRLLSGLRLKVLSTLEVKAGGAIDVSSKGLLGGRNTTYLGGPGETYNESDSIIAGASGSETRCAGGSYGGRGADASTGVVSNSPYGVLEDPRHLGSGGGGNRYFWGGNGGGRVTINAAACIVDGTVRANGGGGSGGFDPSGGGSGGVIRITVGSLSGTGIVEANGGAGNAYTYYSGSGGGGRVAIFYNTTSLPLGNISVRGGSGSGAKASAGTIYLKENAQPSGSIIIGNNNIDCPLYTPWRSALSSFQKLTLLNRARLQTIVSDNATFGEVSVESNSTFLLDTNTAVQTPVLHINGATLTTNVDRSFPVGTDLQLSGGGSINVLNNRTLGVGVFDTMNIHAGTVNMTEGSRLDITSNAATIGGGVTIVKDGSFGMNDSLMSFTILNGGSVTHSLRLFTGLNLRVLGTLEVQSGGAIDASGKGLLGGQPPLGRGETYNTTGDSIIAGATGTDNTGGGGSYGGRGGSGGQGGVSNEPYGLIEDVRHLGAGGGSNRYFWGGHGGGLVSIIANTCIVDGTICANGGEGSGGFDNSGGGSGGGIRLEVGRLSGAGKLEANGGAAYSWDWGGGGGGGRIVIAYDSMSMPIENISVRSGTGGVAASAGTIYLKDNAQTSGSVIVKNDNIDCPLYTPWRSALPQFQRLQLLNRARLRVIASDNTTFGEVSVESNSTFLLDTNTAVQTPVVHISGATLASNVDRSFPIGTDLQLTGGGTINVQNNRTLSVGVFDTTNMHAGTVNITDGCRLDIVSNSVTLGAGATLVKDGTFGANDSIGTCTIDSGGVLTHSLRLLAGLQLHVLDTLDVKLGGAIDVSSRGLLGGQPPLGRGETYNLTGDSIIAGATGTDNTGGGGGYGGRGGSGGQGGVSSEPYGLIEEVRHLGAGGGSNRYFWGGHGGGLVVIRASACIVDGTIRANGGAGSGGFDNSGAGSGGGIRLEVGSLSGTGRIEAIGGTAYSWDVGGCGGGGRIAIFYDSLSLPEVNISVRSGTGGATASAGTIYLKDNAQTTGNVIIDNANIPCDLYTPWRSAITTILNLSVVQSAKLEIGPDVDIQGRLIVTGGGKIGRP